MIMPPTTIKRTSCSLVFLPLSFRVAAAAAAMEPAVPSSDAMAPQRCTARLRVPRCGNQAQLLYHQVQNIEPENCELEAFQSLRNGCHNMHWPNTTETPPERHRQNIAAATKLMC
jgi:hypothetical protein